MKKILKITLISIAFLVSIVLLAAAVLPKEYGLERSIVIEKPREQVFAFVRRLRNQSKYDTWSQRDPKQKMSYRGTDGQVGAVYRW